MTPAVLLAATAADPGLTLPALTGPLAGLSAVLIIIGYIVREYGKARAVALELAKTRVADLTTENERLRTENVSEIDLLRAQLEETEKRLSAQIETLRTERNDALDASDRALADLRQRHLEQMENERQTHRAQVDRLEGHRAEDRAYINTLRRIMAEANLPVPQQVLLNSDNA